MAEVELEEGAVVDRDTGRDTETLPDNDPSPKLSRETQDEVAGGNSLSGEDPDNYPLNSSWSFWFNR